MINLPKLSHTLLCTAALLLPTIAQSYVSSSLPNSPGTLDTLIQYIAERGELLPNANRDSVQSARIDIVRLGVGYGLESQGALKDPSVRLIFSQFRSREENVSGVQFYPADTGSWLTAEFSFNLVHTLDSRLGLRLESSLPFGVNASKFSNPRVNTVGLALFQASRIEGNLGFESQLFFGSGLHRSSGTQNGIVALGTLLSYQLESWVIAQPAGLKAGPYFEADLSERYDSSYDAAFSAPGRPDPIRSFRFALAVLPYFRVSDSIAVELGYVQKFFAYDALASKAFSLGVRFAI